MLHSTNCAMIEPHLREYDDSWAGLVEADLELRVQVVDGPWHVQACPLLRDSPFFAEQARTVEVLVVAEEVFV